ncbi:ABC transporter permease [Paenibacillus whitsoniae]|uniref:Sugar ABC transporter permease n=1 Tax=Paenibacillus whitsoniae TaxID=2496558 RepID=A0A3S0A6R1_9BACL|nr:ABC transporter permease subunit [Paenibacillus whitsoniae]RTE10898.1 sugar ABC transporter permease [Paenibacillus whitsoniae]
MQPQQVIHTKPSLIQAIKKDYRKNKWLILMALPVVAWYILFHYVPMYGVIIAFKQFSPVKGIWASNWVGLKHFYDFFNSISAWRVIRNTLLINIYQLIFAFPAPIILALLLNEIKSKYFKKTIQTVTYLPHFVSMVVICGMIIDFFAKSGLINDIIAYFGGSRTIFLVEAGWFRTIYVGTGIWQGIGWGSIIYLAALTAIDTELYEAATIDGAGRWRQFSHITLPGIAPTIVILLIMNIGHMMSEGYEKVILLYNPSTYETADIISSYVYRRGLVEANYSFSAAVGLFNSIVNLILIVAANYTSRKVNETSLW